MKMNLVSKGAESKVYSIRFMGRECILKRRMEKNYRVRELDNSMRLTRTKSEAKIMGMVSELDINSPCVLLVDRYDIVMERIGGRNLNGLASSTKDGSGLEGVFHTLGIYAARLHNGGIVHGDFTPANIIIGNGNKAYLIDFGLSEVSNSLEDKALDILLMKRSISGKQYAEFIGSYKKNAKNAAAILERLREIEKRGRYNTRTLAVN